ncbi:MAG: TIGR04197 family type VII secretion effector [Streptococcaceae bacterium]|jgi:type VII secretion effector (TIGR04197 family)|nr:TIGR04197 family type VII secretion effector [Streptococcaceae bacterium]MCL2681195.1 TIGR04197 family type VII secretion effector [Streptococcaceae bacterium]
MGIKHDPEKAAGYTKDINGKLGAIKNTPTAQNVSYSNLWGVTKGVEANNKYLTLAGQYKTAFTQFSDKINAVSKAFASLDVAEAKKIEAKK